MPNTASPGHCEWAKQHPFETTIVALGFLLAVIRALLSGPPLGEPLWPEQREFIVFLTFGTVGVLVLMSWFYEVKRLSGLKKLRGAIANLGTLLQRRFRRSS